MKNQKDIDDAVERTLASWDGLAPARLDHSFYVRLMVRLNQPRSSYFSMPHLLRWGVVGLVLLTSLNIYAVWNYEKRLSLQDRHMHIQIFAQSLHPSGSVLSDILD